MSDGIQNAGPVGEEGVGFNLDTQKLHCVVTLDDTIGKACSELAGPGYYRAFVVEERATGEILLNQRFRYTNEDSWQQIRLNPDKQRLPKKEQIEFLVGAAETVMITALTLLARTKPPDGIVGKFYPPDPDDGDKTLEWLIAQDLVEVTVVDGVPVSNKEVH